MIQIHVITRENRHLYEREMIEQHRLRHQCYIVERKWEGLQDRDGMEFDQFDDDDAIYLPAIEDGRVIGGTRMYPTTKPHVLSTICPELANARAIPIAPDIYEWTRLYVAKDRRGDGRFAAPVSSHLWAAALEFALEEGIRELSHQYEAFWLPRLHQHGWQIKPLGMPTLIKNEFWIAATCVVSAEVVQRMRSFYGITGSILVRRGLAKHALKIAA